MAKKVYLVDTENVGSVWVDLLPFLGKQDKLLLFYTIHSSGISYDDLLKVMNQSEHFEMIECFTGRNGLDFQLVSYLGYLIKSAPKSEFIIISNDNGYDAAVKFWKARGMNVMKLKAQQLRHLLQQNAEQSEDNGSEMEKEQNLFRDLTSEAAENDGFEVQDETEGTQPQQEEALQQEEQESFTEDTENPVKKKKRRTKTTEKKENHHVEEENLVREHVDAILQDEMDESEEQEKLDFSVWLPENAKSVEQKKLLQVFRQAGRKEIHKIYVGMVKSFGQAQGGIVYHALKPHISEIYDQLD